MKTFIIDESSLHDIAKRVAAVNRKAAKRGAPLVGLKVVRTFTQRQQKDHSSRVVYFKRAEVEIVGSNPVIRGYVFAARIRHGDPKIGNIIDVSPEFDESLNVEAYRQSAPSCQHCNFKRRRADTYLLLNVESRALIQVGSSCLQEFLGTDDIGIALDVWGLLTTLADLERAADRADREDNGDTYGGGGGRRFHGWKIEEFVAACLVDMRARGFVSRKMVQHQYDEGSLTTGEVADMRLSSPEKFADKPTGQDFETAKQVIEYILNLPANSTFEQNLIVLFKGGVVTGRDTGYAAAGVFVWARAMDELRQKELSKKTVKLNEYVGNVGDKIQFRATVAFIRIVGHDNQYGPSTMMIWRDDAGRTYKWFGSGVRAGGVIGDSYLVRGTVKGHSEREGFKETSMTRCKIGDDAVLQIRPTNGGELVDQHGRTVVEDEQYNGPRVQFKGEFTGKVAVSLDGRTVRLLESK